jgi:transcriptional regulator with XRE-family HTH domain
MNIGQRIKELREKRELSQRKLAFLSGISCATISRIEANLLAPSIYTICEIAKVLNIGLDDLLNNHSPVDKIKDLESRIATLEKQVTLLMSIKDEFTADEIAEIVSNRIKNQASN